MTSRIYLLQRSDTGAVAPKNGSWRENASAEDLVLESWSQGFVSFPTHVAMVMVVLMVAAIAFQCGSGLSRKHAGGGMVCINFQPDVTRSRC